jgi:hypothetical protein
MTTAKKAFRKAEILEQKGFSIREAFDSWRSHRTCIGENPDSKDASTQL